MRKWFYGKWRTPNQPNPKGWDWMLALAVGFIILIVLGIVLRLW